MSVAWAWLGGAVLAQLLYVTALRSSDGMRRAGPTVAVFAALLASVGCVAVSLTHGLTVAVAYGVWTGSGIALTALTGTVVFKEHLTRVQTVGLALVITGVVVLQFSSAHA